MIIPRQNLTPFYRWGDAVVPVLLLLGTTYFLFTEIIEVKWLAAIGCTLMFTRIYQKRKQLPSLVRKWWHLLVFLPLLSLLMLVYNQEIGRTAFRLLQSDSVIFVLVIAYPLLSIVMSALVENMPHLEVKISDKENAAMPKRQVVKKLPVKKEDDKVKKILVAGVGALAEGIEKELLAEKKSRYRVIGYINCKKNEELRVAPGKVVGHLKQIHDYLRENHVDEIVIALPLKSSKKIKKIVAIADYYGIRTKYVPDYESLFGKNYKTTHYGHLEAINVRQLPLDERSAFFLKNTFDKLFAAAALVFLSPLLVIIALLIKLESPGPVMYCPVRVGRRGKPFKVYKFRSMRENDTAAGGTLSTQKDDARITKLGRVLRKYSLDELPQFFNVLEGSMSVVGPRPHRSHLNQLLQESVDKYMLRHYFKPGITGWAQVNGWRGPTETLEQKYQRTRHDLWYIENWSLWLDIKIVYLTVFSRKVHKDVF